MDKKQIIEVEEEPPESLPPDSFWDLVVSGEEDII